MNQKVSVIIPTYNVEKYIRECLESALCQSYTNIEIICIDNNSTDNTINYLKEKQAQHPDRITVGVEEKQNASAARNKGIKLAAGEYIQFLDADDLLDEHKIERQMNIIREANYPDFIASAFIRVSLSGGETVIDINSIDSWLGLLRAQLGITSANLFKKDSILAIDGWDESLSSSQEYDLMFRLMKNNATISFDEIPLTKIRERASGSISKINEEKNVERLIELMLRIKFYLEENKSDWVQNHHKEITQILFDKIRELSNFNHQNAREYFTKHIQPKFTPEVSPATSKQYVMLYNYLGFTASEKISMYLKRFKNMVKN
ncbi:MAG: glycosyltransferase family 2 protein [Melioribacteraceae bacterium]|nr:glycosyltransferase family 2 protein [Melioribacteraceae bacterium]MCF8262870.1 glycosyltransferase family 2 protein [Melioribacteraceae bacterium]MCF8430902.1 glycosyltransferase family 2 protein [Melioribacteraceae bacterium]